MVVFGVDVEKDARLRLKPFFVVKAAEEQLMVGEWPRRVNEGRRCDEENRMMAL